MHEMAKKREIFCYLRTEQEESSWNLESCILEFYVSTQCVLKFDTRVHHVYTRTWYVMSVLQIEKQLSEHDQDFLDSSRTTQDSPENPRILQKIPESGRNYALTSLALSTSRTVFTSFVTASSLLML